MLRAKSEIEAHFSPLSGNFELPPGEVTEARDVIKVYFKRISCLVFSTAPNSNEPLQ